MLKYEDAEKLFATARDKRYGKPMGSERATLLRKKGEDFVIQYHDTEVVTICADGKYVLNSNGYRTMTTKERMNHYSPAIIWQERGTWYVAERQEDGYADWSKKFLFEDGMVVDSNGRIISEKVDPKSQEKIKARLDRMVTKYINGFIDHAIEGNGLQQPGPGDCFFCYMDFDPERMDVDHLLSHLTESYFVPSLLFRAFEERKYRGGTAFIWQFTDESAKRAHEHGKQGGDLWAMRQSLVAFFRKRKHSIVEYIQEYGWGDDA